MYYIHIHSSSTYIPVHIIDTTHGWLAVNPTHSPSRPALHHHLLCMYRVVGAELPASAVIARVESCLSYHIIPPWSWEFPACRIIVRGESYSSSCLPILSVDWSREELFLMKSISILLPWQGSVNGEVWLCILYLPIISAWNLYSQQRRWQCFFCISYTSRSMYIASRFLDYPHRHQVYRDTYTRVSCKFTHGGS